MNGLPNEHPADLIDEVGCDACRWRRRSANGYEIRPCEACASRFITSRMFISLVPSAGGGASFQPLVVQGHVSTLGWAPAQQWVPSYLVREIPAAPWIAVPQRESAGGRERDAFFIPTWLETLLELGSEMRRAKNEIIAAGYLIPNWPKVLRMLLVEREMRKGVLAIVEMHEGRASVKPIVKLLDERAKDTLGGRENITRRPPVNRVRQRPQ